MAQLPSITTLFVDVGNVLFTDSWGPAMRQRAVEQLGFDFAEVAQRSQLTFEGYEEGNISLDEYLDWVVFYQPRSFSREEVKAFMLAQSQPQPDMLDLVQTLKRCYGLKVVVVTNDGREFIVHHVQRFGLKGFVDFFIVSCFVNCRKPEPAIYRMALDIRRLNHPRSYISTTRPCSCKSHKNLAFSTFTTLAMTPRARLWRRWDYH